MKLLAMFVASLFVLAATAAYAQPFYGDPYDGARAGQWQYGAPNVYRRAPPLFFAYAPILPVPLPPAPLPPVAGPVEAPPLVLGWIFGRLTACLNPPVCTAIVVSVGADGANVRVAPDGPVVLALANGVPVIPLNQSGDWLLVAAGCPLMPTWTWSITAGGAPLNICL